MRVTNTPSKKSEDVDQLKGKIMNKKLEEKPEWYGNVSPDSPALQTTMMKQFVDLKRRVPDALLFYRMGDFYELFLQDAVIASQILELRLTSRNKKDSEPVPMAGVPHHAMEGYLLKLSNEGFKVAIAEQEPDPDNPKIFKRVLTRIVTPGVPYDSNEINGKESCWIASAVQHRKYGVAFLDVSTGELKTTEFDSIIELNAELARVSPKEVLTTELLRSHLTYLGATYTVVSLALFDQKAAQGTLMRQLRVKNLSSFNLSPATIQASGGLISYVRDETLFNLNHLLTMRRYSLHGHLVIDQATRRNLEILKPLHGENRKSTLLYHLDKTKTAMGGRLLKDWLSSPLLDMKRIKARQEGVCIMMDPFLREDIRTVLRQVSDLERLSTKLAQGRINPKELKSLAGSLLLLPELFDPLREFETFGPYLPKDLPIEMAQNIVLNIVDEPPSVIKEGEIFNLGVNEELDEIRKLSSDSKELVAKLEKEQKEKTGISSLKIKFNKVFGYFFEVTQSNKDKVPSDWMRKQTLANSERYITPTLKEFEDKILGASEKRKMLEYEMFLSLRDEVSVIVPQLQNYAKHVATIDVLSSFAELASNSGYVKPEVDHSFSIELIQARHPVIEAMPLDEPFVPNDIVMDTNKRIMILTGPNMAGKSTIMRQVALIVLLAQIGSFVPADSAHIGLCDQIFVRVGASDDLARGRSTFMVEMSETAYILNHATERSLILMDEIGRGTSTFDGLSIAWSVAEAIHDKIGAKTIFATHYHELTALADKLKWMFNRHVAVSEKRGEIAFLRTLAEGGAGRSYGIQCARLAGMPRGVIRRSKEILTDLESRGSFAENIDQLNLFTASNEDTVEAVVPEHLEQIEQRLKGLRLEHMSPMMAMQELYALHELLKQENEE